MVDDTKIALLNAAKRLIGERGYAGTSVRELAAVSGTNLAAVNYHFGSREQLLNQAIFELFLEWAGRVAELGPADPDAGPLEQLAARARPTIDGIAEAQPAFVVFLEALLQAQRSPELRRQLLEHYAEQRRRAAESIGAYADGRLPPRMVEVIASYMLAVVDGMQLQALLDPDAIPTGEELAAFYERLADAARASSPAPENRGDDSP